jgi:hypothetical protein
MTRYGLYVSAQQDGSAVSAERRSVHPNVPGVPWWGAAMIAVTATSIGFAFDAGGGRDLTHVFAALYMIGCVAAVLMVRQSGIFTAVVQPPMILFVSVPGAYFLFHGAKLTGFKDIVINCVYPLIERFPLMMLTSGGVLLIGVIRWFVGSRSAADEAPAKATTTGPLASVGAKLGGIFSRSHDGERPDLQRRHAVDRPRPTRSAQPAAAARRGEPPRPRRPRRPLVEDDRPLERSHRRPPPSWQPEEPVELPRRRPAARTTRNPYDHREPYERRPPHDRRSRYDPYDPYEPYEAPPRRRPGPNGAAVASTHHPISRVRYRGSPEDTDIRQERPVRSRARASEAESWEYDI